MDAQNTSDVKMRDYVAKALRTRLEFNQLAYGILPKLRDSQFPAKLHFAKPH